MALSVEDIEKLKRLSYIEVNSEQTVQLNEEINSIINFVEQLRSLDTTHIKPLCHPLAYHQRLRIDTITEQECLEELAAIAPLFAANLYLVPKVIESD